MNKYKNTKIMYKILIIIEWNFVTKINMRF